MFWYHSLSYLLCWHVGETWNFGFTVPCLKPGELAVLLWLFYPTLLPIRLRKFASQIWQAECSFLQQELQKEAENAKELARRSWKHSQVLYIYIISFCSSISHHGRPLLAGKHMENVVAVVCHRIWRTYHSFSQSCSYSWTKSSTRVVGWRTCTARAARAATAFDKMCQALLNFVLDLHSSALIKHHWSSLVDIGCVLFCSFLGSKDWGILGAL